MSLSESIIQLRQNLNDAEDHIKSLETGKKASSSKARANLMKIKNQSHQLRKQIMLHHKDMPTKQRVKKEIAPEPVDPVEPKVEPAKAKSCKKTVEATPV